MGAKQVTTVTIVPALLQMLGALQMSKTPQSQLATSPQKFTGSPLLCTYIKNQGGQLKVVFTTRQKTTVLQWGIAPLTPRSQRSGKCTVNMTPEGHRYRRGSQSPRADDRRDRRGSRDGLDEC